MDISRAAIRAFNYKRNLVSFNDEWNTLKRLGTKAEHDQLVKLAQDIYGLDWQNTANKLSERQVQRAGHTVRGS